MSNKNEVFEYLIGQLRQQVTNNPYKQQCEDLAHEVQSLKNQLRDMSALVAELQGDNIKKSEHISHLTGRVKELHLALVQATGDVEAYKLIRKGGYGSEQSGCCDAAAQVEKSWIEHTGAACPVLDDTVVDIKFRNGEVESNAKALWWSWRTNGGPYEIVGYRVVKQGHGPEQSGCRKGDTQECDHSWIIMPGLFLSEGNPNNVPGSELCSKCGKREWDDKEYKPKNDTQECEHDWCFYNNGTAMMCRICGAKE